MITSNLKNCLEDIYGLYHKKEYIKPDPLQFLYNYKKEQDIEVAGLIAASFAVGRVDMILKTVDLILSKFPNLAVDIKNGSYENFKKLFSGFVYRFYKEDELSFFLTSIKEVLKKYGTLGSCFNEQQKVSSTYLEAQTKFAQILRAAGASNCGSLIPDPLKDSASKRLNLFFRWMIRKDDIDFGIWKGDKRDLIVPLDTHIHHISVILGFVENKKSSNIKTALEITENLKKVDPDDPVRFDFSLSRIGIHPDLDYQIFDKYNFNTRSEL